MVSVDYVPGWWHDFDYFTYTTPLHRPSKSPLFSTIKWY